jgi:serine phosphatase RsbU (regulator of sigma subunit)
MNLRKIFLLAALLLASTSIFAQQTIMPIPADSLAGKREINLDKPLWHWHSGDNAEFAKPDFDDAAWDTTRTTWAIKSAPEKWQNIGWFRLKVRIDSTLEAKPLLWQMAHRGASEIFIDGVLVQRYGKPASTQDSESAYRPGYEVFTAIFQPTPTHEHVIAVRYSDTRARERSNRILIKTAGVGFTLTLQDAQNLGQHVNDVSGMSVGIMFNVGTLGGLAMLHLLLYFFYARARENLYYSLFAIGLALSQFRQLFLNVAHTSIEASIFLQSLSLVWLLMGLMGLLGFFYTVFYPRMPLQFKIFIAVAAAIVALMFVESLGTMLNIPLLVFTGSVGVEIVRVLVLAIIRKRKGSWILGMGGLVFVLSAAAVFFIETASTLQAYRTTWLYEIPALLLFVSMPFAMSLYLARKVSQTNSDLEAQIVEVKRLSDVAVEQERINAEQQMQHTLLEADNARKTAELDEARKLQLSMLPQKMPNIAGLDIAMFMQTATEVGGDYYDYSLHKDGTLTIAIGDATGHGVKAGTMVAATKSLFSMIAADSFNTDSASPIGILRPSSPALKSMNMRSMFMALAVAKIRQTADNAYIVRLANAGMPSSIVFRANDNSVEEILIKSMPLATMANFPYQEREITLRRGDVLIMMSDGFPERFDGNNDILGYDTAQARCSEIAGLTAQQTIEHLVVASEQWAKGAVLNDDMTFVVVRVE